MCVGDPSINFNRIQVNFAQIHNHTLIYTRRRKNIRGFFIVIRWTPYPGFFWRPDQDPDPNPVFSWRLDPDPRVIPSGSATMVYQNKLTTRKIFQDLFWIITAQECGTSKIHIRTSNVSWNLWNKSATL